MERCVFFLAGALTPLHVGVGRSPGVVDLPVARDGFGLPFLPASAVKGSLKSLCIRGCVDDRQGVECRKCLGAFGWDLRVEDVGDESYASPLVFTDGVLLFYPVRVEAREGDSVVTRFAYATSVMQLAQVAGILEACAVAHGDVGVGELLVSLRDAREVTGEVEFVNNIPVGGVGMRYLSAERLGELGELVGGLGRLHRLLLSGGVYVFEDHELFREVVEAGILRQARVRLEPATKTVAEGALWTEEYTSQGAVYAFAVFARRVGHRRALPPDEAVGYLRRLVGERDGIVVLGGKETIGRGLLKLVEAR
ncbi:MAG: type III-B CRISPR module RAMP protein Cmr4 [Crenarchaeota archaeon]|nr:type III-B CRISPR module RAMP protein Cmr4 [Thermoproteota archaeon]